MPGFLVAASLALVAWGALAFGAVYPWAWQPLIAGAVISVQVAPGQTTLTRIPLPPHSTASTRVRWISAALLLA